jgi:two-component system, OmpR family, response regulator
MTAHSKKHHETALQRTEKIETMEWQGHILVVDDEPHFRFGTGLALRRAGYAITEAADGKEALLLLENSRETCPFDLMLVDVQMPGMSGVELVEEVRKQDGDIPIFVISAFLDKSLTDELSRQGCKDILHKPFEPGDLIERVFRVLSERKTRGNNSCPAR